MSISVWIGFDPRETAAFAALKTSIRGWNKQVPIRGVILDDLRARGLYWRPTEKRLGRLFDVISGHPMATEFAISRFLVPTLAQRGLALFMDCDMLVRVNLARVFDEIDKSKAVTCVKHKYEPPEGEKMDGQVQAQYARKNWSSFMVFNCEHLSNKKLTVEMVNTLPGRDLHRFCWLKDNEIGELGAEWNWLPGHSSDNIDPKVVHFTEGGPWFTGFENVPYADEWRGELYRWAA
jgi:lipopolysaccharide biosynthesis glycosyltransferase